ncbi:hypothetical protein CLV63_12151 [Murinocardiopsis flavida]|uniref:Uncharacterized protein n=1 Tax=Murinocardiopsis flavida TaxID=645275 RepID=A0A2P8D177_9ACTN|nr:hypothetical protein [Murinocardiopsis flavida]PSK90926.1 hypothetical protein CLV63_12151 [Murinocardiopsis flavida]
MTTSETGRVSARDVSAFLTEVRDRAANAASPTTDVAFFERKAALFARIAASTPDDEEARAVAENARRQLDDARAKAGGA